MSNEKTYVKVDEFGVAVKEYKNNSKIKKAMQAAAGKAIDKSQKLTTEAPKGGGKPSKDDKKTPAFYLSGSLSKLTRKTVGKKEFLTRGGEAGSGDLAQEVDVRLSKRQREAASRQSEEDRR